MSIDTITLSPSLRERELHLISAWLLSPRDVSPQDWPTALTAFDKMRSCTLKWEGQRLTFAGFYDKWIETRYATSFLEEVMSLADVEAEGQQLLTKSAVQLRQDLIALLAGRTLALPERMFLAYCLYWWNSFGKGYLFELTIFQDLAKEGIIFQAHDLSHREERYSPEDLTILSWHGDIKTSTYFLYVTRSFPLRHDFYISRLYASETRVWRYIVLLMPKMWYLFKGEAQPTTLLEAVRLLPAIMEVQARGETLRIVDYALWKAQIKALQGDEEEKT